MKPAVRVTFQVRNLSNATMGEMSARVGKVLGCRFAPSVDRRYPYAEVQAAQTLGLKIIMLYTHTQEDTATRTYIIMGSPTERLESQIELESVTLSISEYIVEVLRNGDGAGWYIPSRQELLEEAGIEANRE